MKCRICKAEGVGFAGRLRAYFDYEVDVFDCPQCGCRFTERDKNIYDHLHRSADSSYRFHNDLAENVRKPFEDSDAHRLEKILAANFKNKHILRSARSLPPEARILEIGCSLGYLTSWFILKGFNIIATDLSPTAIEHATELFGPHFYMVGDKVIENQAPYDLIYHAGTIGCVEDPIELTRYWLSLLRPGGKLVFNAPNKGTANYLSRLWPYTTPPPDLVTLFPASFWSSQFHEIAEINEETLFMSNRDLLFHKIAPDLVLRTRPLLKRKIHFIQPILRILNFMLTRLLALLIDTSQSECPAEFGSLITMRRTSSKTKPGEHVPLV